MRNRITIRAASLTAAYAAITLRALATGEDYSVDLCGQILSTNQRITPTAAPGAVLLELRPGLPQAPRYVAGGAMSTVVSPDGRTLLVLTSGYNLLYGQNGKLLPNASKEYVFVFDIGGGKPIQRQCLQVPNTFAGIAFAADGQHFYVSGGKDDSVHVYTISSDGLWAEDAQIRLGHTAGNGMNVSPLAAGLAITADGLKLFVANVNNDSVSILDLRQRKVMQEIDLRPGKVDPTKTGVPGGEYPFWITIKGEQRAYVSSWRDREIVVVDILLGKVTGRIKLRGNPNRMAMNQVVCM